MSPGILPLVFAGLLCAQTETNNLDLASGSLAGWEGQGFFLVSADPQMPGVKFGLSSEDAGAVARKGMLRHVFVVPSGTGLITFHARAVRAVEDRAENKLDVLLLAHGRKVIPKTMRTSADWGSAGALDTQLREYAWDVSKLSGQTLQVVLVDDDARPGHYVHATGFRVLPAREPLLEKFAKEIVELQDKHKLNAMFRYDSKRFTALSNAGEKYTVTCLRNCELLHDLFYDHFSRKGFTLEQSGTRLMLAVFDSPQGFEAYLGKKMPATITGIYHPQSHRLVIYDLIRNKALVAERDKALKKGAKILSEFKRTTYEESIEWQMRDRSNDANIGTIMHEAAHQLSFSSGLLEREGDVPIWLAEGLACYCESTEDSSWRGIGEANAHRLAELQDALRKDVRLLPPGQLVRSDEWRNDTRTIGLGYAQSWALFHMLINEQPKALRAYLDLVKERRTSDYRLLDFCEVFGADLRRLEARHNAYVGKLVEQHSARR